MLLLPTYPMSTSTVTSSFSKKKENIYQRFRKHFFFISSALLACKNENLWCFSPYSVTTTYNHMTYNWPNYIPHSLIFKRMQNKRIADNIRAFSFLLTNWNKEPDEERIYRWTEFFTSWTIANEKCTRAHVQMAMRNAHSRFNVNEQSHITRVQNKFIKSTFNTLTT